MEAFNASKNNNNDSNGDGNNEGLSFEEIGRMIGQRWRAIQDDELAKYKELAKRDSERYREQMKTFYKDELTLMCKEQTAAAAAVASNNAGDSKMPASQFSNTPSSSLSGSSPITAFAASSLNVDFSQASQQTMMNSSGQRQDQLLNNILALSSMNNNLTHNSNTSNMYSNSVENNQATNNNNQHLSDMDTSMDDQVLQLLIQHQQQQTPTMSQASSEAILKLALSRKVSMQQRQQKLSDELRVLQLKMSLLDTMLAKEAMSNMSSHRQYQAQQQQQGSSGMSTNIDSRLLSVLTGTNNSVGDINSQQGAPSMNMNGTQQDFRSMFGNNNISQQQQQDPSGRLQQIMNNQQGQQGIMNNQQGQQGSPPLMNNDNNNDNGSSMQISAEQILLMQNFVGARGNNR